MGVAHGGQVERAARAWGCERAEILDLSTGVQPEPRPTALADALRRLAPTVGWYPDSDGEPARSALASALDVHPSDVLVGAGAQSFVEVMFVAMQWTSVFLQEPEYGEVRRCAMRAGVEVRCSALGSSWGQASAAWVTSPHGATGALRSLPDLAAGVLDESYASFEARRLAGVMPSWIRIGSLTKSFSIPGLRMGYAIAEAPVLETLRSYLPPWPAPTLAAHLLPELLPTWAERDCAAAEGRERLSRLLEQHGWSSAPSHASFVLARPAGRLPNFEEHRILVRTFPEWATLDGWVRFGLPGSAQEWARLEIALGDTARSTDRNPGESM